MSECMRTLGGVGTGKRNISTGGTSSMMRRSSERGEFTGGRRILRALASSLG